jgi:dihydroxy-acid dehydratase
VLFNTITVSDGISMGSPGMRYSLVSREVIADSIETVVAPRASTASSPSAAATRTCPAARWRSRGSNRPAVFVYGGTIRPAPATATSSRSSRRSAQHAAGKLSRRRAAEVERTAIPGPGSCGGMYTANTMASAIEALGLSLPEQLGAGGRLGARSATTAAAPARPWCAGEGGHHAARHPDAQGVRERHHRDDRARRLDQRRAAPAGDRARRAGVKLTLDDFTRIGKRVPVLADLRPSGKYAMSN